MVTNKVEIYVADDRDYKRMYEFIKSRQISSDTLYHAHFFDDEKYAVLPEGGARNLYWDNENMKHIIAEYTRNMEERRIVWDEAKNEKNKRDHDGLGFETARYVFADSERIWRFDRSENNTSGEERWQTIGKVGKLLFVVYTEKESAGAIETRLISAGIAEKHERRSYNGCYRIDGKGWAKDS